MDAAQNQIRFVRVVDHLAEECQKKFLTFLEKFKDGEKFKYIAAAEKMHEYEQTSIPISFNDLMSYNQLLSKHVMLQFYKLYPYLCKTVQKFVNTHIENTKEDNKEYVCHFTDFPTLATLRELKTAYLGKLTKFRAQVIRSHPVHPELIVGTFKCNDCGTIIKDVEQEFIYTQPTICANPQCRNRKSFELQIEKSKFVDFQKVRVQETQGELPRGSVPRSMDIILRNNIVERAQPGDQCEFIGTLILVPDVSQMSVPGSKITETKPIRQTEGYESGVTGLKSTGYRELSYNMAFLASYVSTVNNRFADIESLDGDESDLTYETFKKRMSDEELARIYQMSTDGEFIVNLSESLFPGIYGHDDVKKGILMMLFGGVSKVTGEGTKLRGDINVCIVGDPSTAKSEFLKRIEEFAHRAVYTSGKASSAAGLTAAVVRDQESFEYVIEAGALMLANNGICCIDEFDKMEIRDQVAIHEAMEQQTITLSKAGIKATLNARTSILAAANPIHGRYDRSKSLRHNISLSAPIMSRFDLFFVLVDEANEEVDRMVARRIIGLHLDDDSINSNLYKLPARKYSDEEIRRYITFARCFDPFLSEEASELIVKEYKRMRERDDASGDQSAWRITVRQLESLVRLSEAFARMRLSDDVEEADVRMAVSLFKGAEVRVEQPRVVLAARAQDDGAELEEVQADDGVDEAVGHHVTMTYDEYYRVTGALISRMKAAGEEDERISKADLVHWYLETVIDTIDTEDALFEKQVEIERVVERLIDKDNVLMAVTDTTVVDGAEVTRELLTLHPNVNLQ